LVDKLNDRFGTDFKQADQLFFDQVAETAAENETLITAARANTLDNFKHVFDRMLEGFFVDRMEGNEEIFDRIMNDPAFRNLASEQLMREVYEWLRDREPSAARASSSSGIVPDRTSAHIPTSTRALLRASAALDSSTPTESTAGTVFGMSITVVTPPAAAASVRVPKSSFCGKPGSRLCTCTSIAPGSTYMPRASTICAFEGAGSLPTLVMTPSATCTSTSRGPSGVWTMPPSMTSAFVRAESVKLEVGDSE